MEVDFDSELPDSRSEHLQGRTERRTEMGATGEPEGSLTSVKKSKGGAKAASVPPRKFKREGPPPKSSTGTAICASRQIELREEGKERRRRKRQDGQQVLPSRFRVTQICSGRDAAWPEGYLDGSFINASHGATSANLIDEEKSSEVLLSAKIFFSNSQ